MGLLTAGSHDGPQLIALDGFLDPPRSDGNAVDPIRMGERLGHQRVTGLMVSNDVLFPRTHDPLLFLQFCHDSADSLLEVGHLHRRLVMACCEKGRLVDHVGPPGAIGEI